MGIFSGTSAWRYLGVFVLILAVLIAGTWMTIRTTSDHLLYESATRSARNWSQYLTANVSDLEQIAAGERPSSASVAFFESARNSGEMFRYIIFNPYGYSTLISDRNRITSVDVAEYNETAARAARSERPIVDAKEGDEAGEPAYFAEAYTPVMVGGRPVAVVAAYLDQTEQRDSFYRAFLTAALSLCLLTALSFGLPAVAWYRRTEEKQQSDRRALFLAHHDQLTGLSNRARMIGRLDVALATLPPHEMIAVHIIDIDHFKQINDTLGHDGGDHLLNVVGQRLRAITRYDDLVARLGGDEFAAVQTDLVDKSQAASFASRLVSSLGAPVTYKEHEIRPSFTIGVALAPADGDSTERLLKSADLALYAGKLAGRNCVRFFSPEMDEALQRRVKLEKIIRDAVARDAFVLYYQPVFEMTGNRLIGFEALIRLPAPDGTLIPPAEFIPLAEELRLIDKIGAWVMLEACRTAKTWPKSLTVAVNLSPAQFEQGQIESAVATALERSGLEPQRLELEITETLLLTNSESILATLKRLRQKGLSIVMDDFGTGYSSLSYLWKFPFDKIKIDRSFMEGFTESGRDVEAVIKSIIALGRELNMRVTVEGVESASQVNFLYDAHADQVQGFFFGAPESAADAAAHIRKRFPDVETAAAVQDVPAKRR